MSGIVEAGYVEVTAACASITGRGRGRVEGTPHVYWWCKEQESSDEADGNRVNSEIKVSRVTLGRGACSSASAPPSSSISIAGDAMEVEEKLDHDRVYRLSSTSSHANTAQVCVIEEQAAGTSSRRRYQNEGLLRVVAAFDDGEVLCWEMQESDESHVAHALEPCVVAKVAGAKIVSLNVVSSVARGGGKTSCVIGTSNLGMLQLELDWKKKTHVISEKNAAASSTSRESASTLPPQNEVRGGAGGLLQNVFGSFTRFQAASSEDKGTKDESESQCAVHSMKVIHSAGGDPVLVAMDQAADLWCWQVGSDRLNLIEKLSMKTVCLTCLDLLSWSSTRVGAVDGKGMLIKPLDVAAVPGGKGQVALLALLQSKDQFQKVVIFIFGFGSGSKPAPTFVRHIVLSDAWLVGATMNLQLKLTIASDLNSFVVKGNDGHMLAFAGNLNEVNEVAAIHTNKYVWDACPFTSMGQVQFLLLMHDLTYVSLSQTLLDMCNNIVEALPKQRSDSDAGGLHGAVDTQLKDKLEQHFQFVNLLHSRGWLDMLDMKTAGKIVRAGEHVAALQCIRSKESLLQEQNAQGQQSIGLANTSMGSNSKTVSLQLIQSIINDAGQKVSESMNKQLDAPKQPWEVFYSKPLSSMLFLDMIAGKVEALISRPAFEISKDTAASTNDVQIQNAILNVMSRTVTETLNAVESWIRAVDTSCIPARPGAFGHQEGYSWTACPSLCNCLLSLSRLCIHYRSQWKTKAPNMVPRLSIQLHSLITQYLSVCDAFLASTSEEEKLRNSQHFRTYIESGEEILGALLEAAYEESNHMIQNAVAELAEMHCCYAVLYLQTCCRCSSRICSHSQVFHKTRNCYIVNKI